MASTSLLPSNNTCAEVHPPSLCGRLGCIKLACPDSRRAQPYFGAFRSTKAGGPVEKPRVLEQLKRTVTFICVRIQSCSKKSAGGFIVVSLDGLHHPLRTSYINRIGSENGPAHLDLLFFGEPSEVIDQLLILRLALDFWNGTRLLARL